MPRFSKKSLSQLSTCHPDLQRLLNQAINFVDFSVLEGHRNKEDQDKAVAAGNSKTPWPQSKHNSLPSMAVDIMPYPIDFNDKNRIYQFIGFIRGVAAMMGIKIRCGADWDSDFDINDQKFNDLPHVELVP